MVDPGRYSQRHTALTLSERVRKSGLSSANAGACPGPSGSIVYEVPHCAIGEPLSRPYALKASDLQACSSLKPRQAPLNVNGWADSWKLQVGENVALSCSV